MLTIDKFEEASEVVKRVTQDTKLIFSDYFSQMTGNKVYFKPENMQRTGAYKLRGAYYKISTLTEEERAKGLITLPQVIMRRVWLMRQKHTVQRLSSLCRPQHH